MDNNQEPNRVMANSSDPLDLQTTNQMVQSTSTQYYQPQPQQQSQQQFPNGHGYSMPNNVKPKTGGINGLTIFLVIFVFLLVDAVGVLGFMVFNQINSQNNKNMSNNEVQQDTGNNSKKSNSSLQIEENDTDGSKDSPTPTKSKMSPTPTKTIGSSSNTGGSMNSNKNIPDDLVIPSNVKNLESENTGNSYIIVFSSEQSVKQIEEFFKSEMSKKDWKLEGSSNTDESNFFGNLGIGTLSFSKDKKSVSILMNKDTENDKLVNVIITYDNK